MNESQAVEDQKEDQESIGRTVLTKICTERGFHHRTSQPEPTDNEYHSRMSRKTSQWRELAATAARHQ